MRCRACNVLLTEAEDQQRFRDSGARVELCSGCGLHIPPDLEVVGGVTSDTPGFANDDDDAEFEWDVIEDPDTNYEDVEFDDFSD